MLVFCVCQLAYIPLFLLCIVSQLQDMLNHSSNKAGLCVICSCTNPKEGKLIKDCTAPTKMAKCFGEDLGYSVINVNSDLSTATMRRLLYDLGRLKMPHFCSENFRFVFYFFGHGNKNEICLTDGNFPRQEIISEVQKITKSRCKIVIMDSCRTRKVSSNSVKDDSPGYKFDVIVKRPLQATEVEARKSQQVVGSLGGDESGWEERDKYPETINTIVIYSAAEFTKALYNTNEMDPEMKGCGLMTYFFTKLASTLNQPLSALLTEVRKNVYAFIREHLPKNPPQILVFDDVLMDNINLLAESRGKGKYFP